MAKPMTMLREKLFNAILYFAKNTKYCNTTKISKLLYFLDFMHFKETGYPSIGLRYYSFERGPVPKDFWLEIRDGNVPEDFTDKLRLVRKTDEFSPGYKETEFIAIANPDMDVFAPREKKILENLAFIYKESRANTISEVTHLANQPWDITKKKKGLNKPIDYIDSIDSKSSLSLDEAADSIKDYDETVRNLHLEPTR
jgi:uncharacterized phage-associated protein